MTDYRLPFRVTLLGTGCPVVDTERFGPALLVTTHANAVMIDCGSGATQRLLAVGLTGADLDAVLLTHLHSDHIVDLFQLVISSWHQGRERPQRVYGPRGTRRYVEGLMDLWQPELKQRIAHEQRPSSAALQVEVSEIAPGPVFESFGLRIDAFEVDHRPVKPAFGFAIAAAGRRVVVSGDTAPCDSLVAAAKGADLLIHEVFVHGGTRPAETSGKEAIRTVATYHTLSNEVGKIAAKCRVGCLALTHFVPPYADRAALLAEVKADFAGPIVLGEDLMTFDLVAGTVRHGLAHWALGGAGRPSPKKKRLRRASRRKR